jgi:hypothetical protein
MFKEFTSGVSKFFGKKWIPIIVIIAVCVILLGYSTTKSSWSDGLTGMDLDSSYGNSSLYQVQPAPPAPAAKMMAAPSVVQGGSNTNPNNGYALQPVSNPADLLPTDQNSQWAQLNPINNGNIQTPDLLQAGYHIGLDTIGQTMKNANLQLRSDPIIQKTDVGPWNISTYEADYGRVPLEIGVGSK